jgi:hypothetical protein
MTWYELTLHHGPKLIHQRPDRDDPALDVTDRACEFLFAQIRLADDVMLLDILRLLDNPVMRTVFRREYVNELLTEASFGLLNKDKLPYEKVEYLELNQLWHLDSATSEFTSAGKFGMTGKGIIQPEDVVEHDMVIYKKGERINWSVSMTSVRELLHLPVRLNSTVQICEDDVYAKRYGHALQTGVNHQISLGTLIHSLLWELSWHGTPEQRDARKDDLLASKAEVDAGTAMTRPYEDLFEARGDLPKSKVYPMFFDEVGAGPLKAIERAINDLEDTELAQSGLDQAFGGALVLKREFATFNGRQLRVAVSEAKSPTKSGLLTQYDPDSEYAKEIESWDNMVPVGREFGSPDFERLMEEDRVDFQEKLSSVVHECKSTETARHEINPADEWYPDAINVQLALKELGQVVSVGLAAAVWEHYSSSLSASWMSGADTVRSAQKALFYYVSRQASR